MKVHRNLERGHIPKIWTGIAPTFETYRTPLSTQEASSSFNLLNTLLVECTSLFLTSFTYNPNHLPNTSNSQSTFTTYLPWLPMIYTEIFTFILTFRKFSATENDKSSLHVKVLETLELHKLGLEFPHSEEHLIQRKKLHPLQTSSTNCSSNEHLSSSLPSLTSPSTLQHFKLLLHIHMLCFLFVCAQDLSVYWNTMTLPYSIHTLFIIFSASYTICVGKDSTKFYNSRNFTSTDCQHEPDRNPHPKPNSR